MALPQGMPIRPPDDAEPDTGHATTYQASRGGWYPAAEKPVPGTPKTPQEH